MNIYLAGEHPVKNGSRALASIIGGGQDDMNIYMAGGITGNLRPDGTKVAGGVEDEVKMKGVKILESFFYCRDNDWIPKLLPYLGDFLLDSGAFSFRQASARADWVEYTDAYIDWINRHKVKLFFEMDIDGIVPLTEVEMLRKRIERGTGKQPIPVWHANRGYDYYKRMCQEFPYVAVATTPFGIEGRTWRKNPAALEHFIKLAHQNGAKIHGLGYTSVEGIKRFPFDSVD